MWLQKSNPEKPTKNGIVRLEDITLQQPPVGAKKIAVSNQLLVVSILKQVGNSHSPYQLSLVGAPAAMLAIRYNSFVGCTLERGVPRTARRAEAGGDTSPPEKHNLFVVFL
jgi:hypothetical protein